MLSLKTMCKTLRFDILEYISKNEKKAYFSDIKRSLNASDGVVNYHLKRMVTHGIIEHERIGNMKFYQLNKENREKVTQFINLVADQTEKQQ